MKSFLVIGMGRFGTAVAQELTELGQEVLPVRAALRFPEGNHNGRVPRGFGILQRRL